MRESFIRLPEYSLFKNTYPIIPCWASIIGKSNTGTNLKQIYYIGAVGGLIILHAYKFCNGALPPIL